ncbi:hypothetical protein FHW23_003023 [Curtobacterium pusillum]|uniref:WXG100 family type VII secretion target n=1 Tax=Curtobacterium pusillum TaxID=69373 RepID=A0AAW3T9Z3_9MICO|nr:hypothetical protein [Curtobacterium pusillum]MBA8991745.1 hypothetical protein [Curtobacterium pusillum]
MSGLVDVGAIPYTDVDLSGITSGAGKLRTVASAVRDGTADIHSAWTPISQSYEGPGDQELYDAMTPIVPQGTAFGDDLEKVAKALDDFVTEVTPIVAKLKTYVTRGNQLQADVKAHDGAWDEDETLNGENNDIINGVANQVVAYQAAERTCANTIRALDCLAPLHAMSGDGSDDPLGYGYKELPMGTELPWGTAEARKESCGEKTVHFVPNLLKGVVVDGIWGTVQGLGQLVGIDGTGWHLDTLTDSWKGMGSLIGYSAADNSWSWGNAGDAWKGLGKATVGWDEWAKDPGTAAGQAIWGIGSLLIPVAGEAGKVGALGKVGEVAGTVGKAGKVLDLVDAGAWASKGLTSVLPKLGDLKGVVSAGLGDTLHGFTGKIADFKTGLGDFLHGHHGGDAEVPPARSESGADANANAHAHAHAGGSTVEAPPVREPELVGAGGHGGHGESTTTHGGGDGAGHGSSGDSGAGHGGAGHATGGDHGSNEHGAGDAHSSPGGEQQSGTGDGPSGHGDGGNDPSSPDFDRELPATSPVPHDQSQAAWDSGDGVVNTLEYHDRPNIETPIGHTDLDTADLRTPPGGAVFWSGRTGDIGGMGVAGGIATEHGGSTLEQLLLKNDIHMPEYDARKPETVEAWKTVSEKFAEGASGEVHLVGGTGIRPTSIWVTREFEALKNNPAVTKIVQVDPASGYTRVIWPE